MSQWSNFSIWRGRLPHWRADNVVYYVTFRHSRPLKEEEQFSLFRQIMRCQQKGLDLVIVCVLPEKTELMFKMTNEKELSDVIEKAKTKAGKEIVKKSGERFPPFYSESYDHIIRDDNEFEEFWQSILGSSVEAELVEDPSDYPYLYVPFQPSDESGMVQP